MQSFKPARQFLHPLIEKNGGWLSFEQFMAEALYSPEFGYYTRQVRAIGGRGDFSTSARPGSILARALAAWAWQQRGEILQKSGWHLIETGGGDGTLAKEILHSLGWWKRRRLTYHLVEISPILEKQQREKLAGARVFWHRSIESALDAAGARALVFSNELVDAFPCLRLVWEAGIWQEMGLAWQDGRAVESLCPLSDTEVAALQSSALSPPTDSRRRVVEVHRAYRDQLGKIASHLDSGTLLTIDYGDLYPAVYHRQPQGTLRGYFHHQRVEGAEIYQRFGQQDLTADVNFTDLQNWGFAVGLRHEDFLTQRDFILRYVREPDSSQPENLRLTDPLGAGTAFKVLVQCK